MTGAALLARRRIVPIPERSFCVYGLGVTGAAVAGALRSHGLEVVACDDSTDAATTDRAAAAGVELHHPDLDGLPALIDAVDAVIPAPGLPESHPVFAAAARFHRPVLSEFDLAAAWDDRPLLAITGTNGKTTVTTLVTAMLRASGLVTRDVGNTDVPLVAALDDPADQLFVVEASSFRLGHSRHVRPAVGTWLNLAPDHLDVHASLERYEAAKARIWGEQLPTDVAVANVDDPVVMRHAVGPGRVVTFGMIGADYRVEGDRLMGPDGESFGEIGSLFRSLPHDLTNALAAAATARAGGASVEGITAALAAFEGLAHRVMRVGSIDGVAYYDDSKATTPHAVASAVSGFASVVLIAGGRNKGIDLSVLGALAPPVRAVIGIGEAADEVVAAFDGVNGVNGVAVHSMSDAIDAARRLADPGDVVVLSPGCASFDWYRNYHERGEDFSRLVRERMATP